VPITSASELEAVLGQILIKIDKVLYERGEVASLKEARRLVDATLQGARDRARLKALRQSLEAASETLRKEIARDDALRDDMWDCLDYIDFRV
jgi:hypothetical protein